MDGKGRLEGKVVERFDTKQITDTFRLRDFVIMKEEVYNEKVYEDYIKLQCVQKNIDLLDNVRIGNSVIVDYIIKGVKVEKDDTIRYYTNLNCIGITIVDNSSTEDYTPDVIYAKDVLDYDTQTSMIEEINQANQESKEDNVDKALFSEEGDIL